MIGSVNVLTGLCLHEHNSANGVRACQILRYLVAIRWALQVNGLEILRSRQAEFGRRKCVASRGGSGDGKPSIAELE